MKSDVRWDPVKFTDFTLKYQLRSLWQIANWVASHLDLKEIKIDNNESILEIGAGPAILSHMLAKILNIKVNALIQNPEFFDIAKQIIIGKKLNTANQVVCHLDPELKLEWMTESVPVIISYAFLHEIPNPKSIIINAIQTMKNGGILLFIDTMRDVRSEIKEALKRSNLKSEIKNSINSTFDNSFTLNEAKSLARNIDIGSKVEILNISDEVLFDSELNCPFTFQDAKLRYNKSTIYFMEVFKGQINHKKHK